MTVVAEAPVSAPKALTLREKGHAVPLLDVRIAPEDTKTLNALGARVAKFLKLRQPVHCSIVCGDHLGCMVPRWIAHAEVRAAIWEALGAYRNGAL